MKDYRLLGAKNVWSIEKKLSKNESLRVSNNTKSEVYITVANNIKSYERAKYIAKQLACSDISIDDTVMQF